MILKYKLTKQDYVNAYEKKIKEETKKSRFLILIMVVAYLIYAIMYVNQVKSFYSINMTYYVLPSLGVIMFSVLFEIMSTKKTKERYDRLIKRKFELDGSSYEEKTLQIVGSNIIIKSDNSFNTYDLFSIRCVYESHGTVVLCEDDKITPYIIVSSNAFLRDEDRIEFMRIFRS